MKQVTPKRRDRRAPSKISTRAVLLTLALLVPQLAAQAVPASPILNEVAKLLASDGWIHDNFGESVAVSGDTMVIGAVGGDDLGTNSGSAYVFERDETGMWAEVAKLLASDGATGDGFGYSVAVSGGTVVVGAHKNDDLGASSGSAYVYERDEAGAWIEVAKLLASDGTAFDQFGYSVAVSGETVGIGANRDGDLGTNSGSVYVFERAETGPWTEAAKLLASDGAESDQFGYSVAISGETIVVGASMDDDLGNGSGSAYVFERDETGPWIEVAKLLASDGAVGDFFGWSTAISGHRVLIGAFLEDDFGGHSGSAYVFERDEVGTWTEVAKLLASDGEAGDDFGYSVAVSGEAVVVGSLLDDDLGTSSGSAYVFSLAAPQAGTTGLCLDATESCNDYFLSLTQLTADLWQLRGYEYGCAQDTRLVIGTLRHEGSSLYLGLTGSNGASFDSGQLYHRNYVLDFVTQSGTYEYLYTFLDGGVLRSRADSGPAVLTTCADPGTRAFDANSVDELWWTDALRPGERQ